MNLANELGDLLKEHGWGQFCDARWARLEQAVPKIKSLLNRPAEGEQSLGDGGPAFPFVEPPTPCGVVPGMSLRDYFAGKLIGNYTRVCEVLVEAGVTGNILHAEFAKEAYRVADAMLEARKEGGQP